MAELSQQEEQELIEALMAIDWTLEIDDESLQLIRDRCRCSLNGAKVIMENLYGRNLIRYDSDKGGELPAGVPTPTSFWKWKGQSSLLPGRRDASRAERRLASC